MSRNRLMLVVGVIIAFSIILTACAPKDLSKVPGRVDGKGGYLDQIIFSTVTGDQAVTQLQAGAIDVYFEGLASVDLPTIQRAGLKYASFNGLYYDILYNPASCSDGTLNPFNDRKIREATNYIYDRNYINQEIYAGGSLPKWFPIVTQMPDYADLADVAAELQNKYAYNFETGRKIISAEMTALGAMLDDVGKWQFNGVPVELIFIVRSDGDGTRKLVGDYVTTQMEKVGFTVDEQYKNASQASPIWIGSEPTNCEWNLYTSAWVSTSISRDESTIFQEMYLPDSLQGISTWQANTPDPEFQKVGDDLFNSNYKTPQDRHDLMAKALNLALQDSLQVWLIDGRNYSPYKTNIQVTADLAAGIASNLVWPFTIKFTDKVGGTMKVGVSDLYTEPWNPVAGSHWVWDSAVSKATRSGVFIPDPYTGLSWPLHMQKAAITAQEGLPITRTLDWVSLDFAPTIHVPTDAFVDWDAKAQTFITVGTKYPQGLTAKIKSVIYFPSDLYKTTTWHDGSALSVADFIMSVIMQFDRASKDSAIYDENAVPQFEAMMQSFKGFKIDSTNPLTVEWYTDSYVSDAELNVPIAWPDFGNGEAPWEIITISNLAEADGKIAYSAGKATAMSIEQTNFVGGSSLDILSSYLDTALANKTIPYAATLGKYITANQAVARYTNLKNWYTAHKHFWLGTGPYYIDQPYVTERTISLMNYGRYSLPSDQWASFGEPKIAAVAVTGPTSVKVGDPAEFNIAVTFKGQPYTQADIKSVKYLIFDATNAVVATGDAEFVTDGSYKVTVDTSRLTAGANKFEAIVVSKVVAIPTFFDVNFVTTP